MTSHGKNRPRGGAVTKGFLGTHEGDQWPPQRVFLVDYWFGEERCLTYLCARREDAEAEVTNMLAQNSASRVAVVEYRLVPTLSLVKDPA